MSLISSRNFLAPFQSKVHMVTIILGALAFAVLRLSGGSLSIERTSRPLINQPPAFKTDAPQVKARPAKSRTDNAPSNIESALGIDPVIPPWDRARNVEKRPADKPKKSGAMDEIEKTLGMK